MANLEVIALDQTTPQLRAPGVGDTYVFPRPVSLTTLGVTKFSVNATGFVSCAGLNSTGDIGAGAFSGVFGHVILSGATNQLLFNNTGVSEISSTSLRVDNGASTSRDLQVRRLRTEATTVGSLGSAATAGAGARSLVTNATLALAAGLGTTVAAGGANIVPVFSDGTNWIIG